MHMRLTGCRWTVAALFMLAACNAEFATPRPRALGVDTASSVQMRTVMHQDTVTERVVIVLDSATSHDSVYVGGVQWVSDDPDILEIDTLPHGGAPTRQLLSMQLEAKFVGKSRGVGHFHVTAVASGFQALPTYRDSILVLEKWMAVSAGTTVTCGVTVANEGLCWGAAATAQLVSSGDPFGFGIGDGTVDGALKPTPVLGGLQFASISAGDGTTCGLTTSALSYCWGVNSGGQVGDGTTGGRFVPTIVEIPHASVTVTAGKFASCMVTTRIVFQTVNNVPTTGNLSNLLCWGNPAFTLGEPTIATILDTPNLFLTGGLAIGADHACAMMDTGVVAHSAWCWGQNASGQLGPRAFAQDQNPEPVQTAPGVGPDGPGPTLSLEMVSAGYQYTCGVGLQGTAMCWGTPPDSGQLGGPVSGSFSVVQLPARVWSISAAKFHTCAVLDTAGLPHGASNLYCWGANSSGELGDSSNTSRAMAEPIHVPAGVQFSTVSASAEDSSVAAFGGATGHTCGLTTRGAIYCWGANDAGQLGDSTQTGRSVPRRIDEPGVSQLILGNRLRPLPPSQVILGNRRRAPPRS